MLTTPFRLAAAAAVMTLAACASGPTPPAIDSGGVLVGTGNKMTLYTFDRDSTPGKSVCNGQCAVNWPPLAVAAGAAVQGDFSILTRDDGSRQWAYKGKPLYFWVKDAKPGDRTGDDFNKVWHIARP